MKLISLNTWGCRITKPLFEYIKNCSQATEVFCFQEILKGGKGKTDKDEVKSAYEDISNLLPKHTGYFFEYGDEGYYYEKRKDEVDFQFGIACFVQRDLSQTFKQGIHLYDPQAVWKDYSGRFAAGAALAVQVQGYGIINVHGMWQGSIKEDTEAKIKQSKLLIELSRSLQGKKILCGDFNLLPHTQAVHLFCDKYTDLIKEYGISDTRGSLYPYDLRYSDYIFTDKTMHVSGFAVPRLDLSDHLPLVVEFK